MSVAASTAIALGVAAGTAGAGIYAAHKTSESSDTAANLASKANAEALAFQKQQAETEYRNQETTRKANFDQHVAQVTANNRTRQALGLAPVEIPAYVASVDPAFTGGPSIGAMAGSPTAPPPVTAPVNTPQARAAAALRAAPTSLQPTFLPQQQNGMTLGTIAGAPLPSGQSPWVGPTAQQLEDLRKRVQS